MENINYETFLDVKYLGQCINETLRIDPPIWYSSTLTLKESAKIGDYYIRKDEQIIVSYVNLAHNP